MVSPSKLAPSAPDVQIKIEEPRPFCTVNRWQKSMLRCPNLGNLTPAWWHVTRAAVLLIILNANKSGNMVWRLLLEPH